MKVKHRWLALFALAAMSLTALIAAATGVAKTAKTAAVSGSITVWVDSARLPDAQAYKAANPNVTTNIVTFDGDGNGATDLQTKIQLWNRIGSGWPDVVFSEQVNDPIWMASPAFKFAEPLNKGLIPKSILSKWPAPSTAQCTINGVQYCVQDNLAPDVLWYNKTLMAQDGISTVPTTWQQWAADGAAAVAHGDIIGEIGESYGAWMYFWANQCPLAHFVGKKLEINSEDSHCVEMANLLDPLIASKALAVTSVFSADFPKTYGGASDKVLFSIGPAWYAQSIWGAVDGIPAGQMTAAPPPSWNGSKKVTTGQIGGGPWIISKHSKNLKAAANFVIWSTTVFNPPITSPNARPGLPGYEPLAKTWLAALNTNPYFASPGPAAALKVAANEIWSGWDLVSYPDQPVWSTVVIPGLEQGQKLLSLLGPFADGLAQAAATSGYQVIRHS